MGKSTLLHFLTMEYSLEKIHYINCLAVACPVSLPCLIVALSHKAALSTIILLAVLVYMRHNKYFRYKTFQSHSAVIHGFIIFIQGTQVRTLLSMVAFYNHFSVKRTRTLYCTINGLILKPFAHYMSKMSGLLTPVQP